MTGVEDVVHPEWWPWWVIAFPAASYGLLVLFGRKLNRGSAWLGSAATLAGLCVSLALAQRVFTGGTVESVPMRWLSVGDVTLSLAFEVTPLSALMILIVTLVGFLVHVYSYGYMKGERRFSSFYQHLSLFMFSMLGLVMARDLLSVFIFWELVGVTSFLLIGFYYARPEARRAAQKAFFVTRLGDVGLFVAMLYAFQTTGSLAWSDLFAHLESGVLAPVQAATLASLIFVAAAGKSGQFPLHVWLPDAMEGPTPVSALIHAATMVAAGVFLVARAYPLFSAAPEVMGVVAVVGAATAFLAAVLALVQDDLKRVLAYSTVSQLGYMMLALGVGGYGAALFHLTTHAFFKALLFLAAGSLYPIVGTYDMRAMGGLWKKAPFVGWSFLIGMLALIGLPPLSGYFSKEAILAHVYGHNVGLFLLAVATVALTALYMGRAFMLVFVAQRPVRQPGRWAPAVRLPVSMAVPVALLALLALTAGALETPQAPVISRWVSGDFPDPVRPSPGWISPVVVAVGLLALLLVYFWFRPSRMGRWQARREVAAASAWAMPLNHRLFIDALYERLLLGLYRFLGQVAAQVERYLLEGLVHLAAGIARGLGWALSRLENGQVQGYNAGALFVLGALILAYVWLRLA
ncbi:NADH-quinone oxidoreductase subunit L [Kyrpidia spormannii]|uniref:NADH-quinone oxidoreductase subunit L n=2 Tax=Kyrpidia spormannii TaxID=2055160 RepID=A0ACA8ZD27_9BACL|nr:NADH-quinone oxidoreductase subunit L [Kyrpidia spormannii]CAB3394944.1 NADH-quinone oxidoreductase subunit L [Kyrpidia spormannii]CAB3395907.1 NADH-quinone oxidoreductase subunit L [Kyrpidia spormannii]